MTQEQPDLEPDRPDPTDPDHLAALEHLQHWWREPLAGFIAIAAGLFDAWHYGRDAGLTSALDEALIIGGIVLIAGTKKLFYPDSLRNGNGKN